MATAVVPEIGSASPKAVAPWWHTALLIGFFVLMAAGGAALQYGARGRAGLVPHRPAVIPLYVSLLVAEWGLVYYVWKGGLRRTGITLLQFVGGRWDSVRAVFQDLLLAFGIWILWKGITLSWVRWLWTGHAASISPLVPRGVAEAVLWVLLSISAGISEEFAFRGYLQRQLRAFTGRPSLALFLQVIVFGIAHGYQGIRACLLIAIYGALLTLLALWRKSLRPGMIAHAWTDIAGGLLG
ncbi:MAG TPA: CPBP family intramembrane glutamic endopeptidase [Candidatus Acidoferrales bacterium]